MLEPLYWIIRRDLTIAMRRRADVFTTLIFFVIVVSLFPLGIGPEPETLRQIAPGIVWVGALLASMLALEQIFSADHRDGTLEQMLLTPQPVSVLVVGKILAHWLVSGVPLVIMAPVLGLQYNLSADVLLVLMASLLLDNERNNDPSRLPSALIGRPVPAFDLPAVSPIRYEPPAD